MLVRLSLVFPDIVSFQSFSYRFRDLCVQLCFLRQFKSSIRKSDYLALRLGFITVGYLCSLHYLCCLLSRFTIRRAHYNYMFSFSCLLSFQKHKLPLSYDFHKYMVRSMEDEFHGMLGIRYVLMKLDFCFGSYFACYVSMSVVYFDTNQCNRIVFRFAAGRFGDMQ